MIFHPFHIVEKRPWPLTSSISALTLTLGFINYFHNLNYHLLIFAGIILIISSFQWWRDISREASFQGFHTFFVLKGLKIGILLFILSEVFFFISFFWAFFIEVYLLILKLGLYGLPKIFIHLILLKFLY